MPQLHLYLSQEKAQEVKRRAASKGMSVSAYLSEIVDKDLTGQWPVGYFESCLGQWRGEPLARPEQGAFEDRLSFDDVSS